jgi:tetratricopeptide (TPR) repeat protein
MPRRALPLLALALVLALPARAGDDPLRAQLFSGLDRRAVAVGGEVTLTVEALAAPASVEARGALDAALAGLDVGRQLDAGLAVVRAERPRRRWDGKVLRWERRFRLRVLSADVRTVPPVRLAVRVGEGERVLTTRTQPLRAYEAGLGGGASGDHVVSVVADVEIDGARFRRLGSAFLVGGDALVTAYHVVVGARAVRVRLPDGREVETRHAWALDPAGDVAVLYLDAETARAGGLRSLAVAPAEASGDVAFTAGWPERAQVRTAAQRYADLVLGDRRLRLSANAVRPGDSGGPLLDEAGRVLGVVVSGRSTDGVPDLLREDVCVAASLDRALVLYRTVLRPVRLGHALRAAAERLPAAQAHAAVGGLDAPAEPDDLDRRPHVLALLDALRRAPRDPALYYLAGTALEDAGEAVLAAGALDAAWRSGYVPAGYSLGHHLLRRGHVEAAAGVFETVSEGGAYARLGAFGRAQALVVLGRPVEAERSLETVLDHDARFAPALYLLGVVRVMQGRTAEAEALAVRLADRPAWADALREAIGTARPAAPEPGTLAALPRVALR